MFLGIDIGNTNVTVGAFEGDRLRRDWRLKTDLLRSADEYGALLVGMMQVAALDPGQVDSILAGSVVPSLRRVFREMGPRYFRCEVEFVTHKMPVGITLDVDYPEEVGADRIINAVAASRLYGEPAIVVDFGTATTFDVVLRGGVYVGGAILPGIQISMNALFEQAAQLARVELCKPPSVIGRNTVTCIQSGFYYGFLGQMESILRHTIQALGEKPIVIATGGLAELLARDSPMVDVVDPVLTLKGLQLIHASREREK